MAKIPYTGIDALAPAGTIQVGVPNDYNTTQASPDAFGAGVGQAAQVFGQGAQQAGNAALEIATKQQELHNQAAADAATNDLLTYSRKAMFGDPDNPGQKGFLALQGREATDAYRGFSAGLDQRRADILGTLNPKQALLFDGTSRRYLNGALERAGSHAIQQGQAWQGQTVAATRDNFLQNAALSAANGDQNGWMAGVGSAQQKMGDYLRSTGADEETVQRAGRDIYSKAIDARIQEVSVNNPSLASQLFDANKDKIDVARQAPLMEMLKVRGRTSEASSLADASLGGPAPTGPVPDMVRQQAAAQGLDPADTLAAAHIESRLGTLPNRPGSQYRGVFQMGDAAWAARGGTAANRDDPAAQVQLGVSNLAHSKQVASQALGRDATGAETYLVHQQGDAGGPALLKADPTTPAVTALAPAYGGDADKARAAIVGNGGKADMTAGQFVQLWDAKFRMARGAVGGLGMAGARPQTVFGDSLGVGVKQASGAGGTAAVGANPDAVLDQINATGADDIRGQNVVLSSGISNAPDPAKLAVVQQQIDSLKARGANVTLLGVGSRPDLASLNGPLAELAQKNGVQFRPVQAGPDGVHPTAQGYKAIAGGDAPTGGAPDKGPPQPQQTQADFYRANFEAQSDQVRTQAMALHPDDPQFADLAVARVQQKMSGIIRQQEIAYKADNDLVWQAANGDLAKGIAPGSVEQLVAASPAVAAAWDRMQVQQPQVAHSVATRLLSQNARLDDHDAKTYGSAFMQVFQRIHAPDGSAGKIVDPTTLYGLVGNGLTMAGVEKARQEIAGKRTPEGEAESALRAQTFKIVRAQVSGSDDGLGLKDPKGEELFGRAMAMMYDAAEKGRNAGKTPAQMFNPASPDWVGNAAAGLKRTLAQRTADMLSAGGDAAPAKPAEGPGFFGRIFGGAPAFDASKFDLSKPDGIVAAYKAGMPRAQAEAAAAKLGYTANGPASGAPAASPRTAVPTGE